MIGGIISVLFSIATFLGAIFLAGSPLFLIYYKVVRSFRVKKHSTPENYTIKDRTKREKVLDNTVWFLCGIFVWWLLIHVVMGLGIWKGKSYETYLHRTSYKLYCDDLPEGAEDFRYRSENFGLAASCAMAFTLHGQEYDDFIKYISEKYHDGKIVGYLYKRELDYTGMKVSETINNYDDYDNYIGFPTNRFKYVIDDDIMDYTIIYYDYYLGIDEITETIVTNPETGRIVFYSFGSN